MKQNKNKLPIAASIIILIIIIAKTTFIIPTEWSFEVDAVFNFLAMIVAVFWLELIDF